MARAARCTAVLRPGKAELEHLLRAEAARSAGLVLYLLRPPIVLGPHAVGAKNLLPAPLARLARQLAGRVSRLPVPVPVPVLPLQFVHEEDAGRALLQCVVAAGPPGAYNIAPDGIVTTTDIARELGVLPLPFPPALSRSRPGPSRPCLSCRPLRNG